MNPRFTGKLSKVIETANLARSGLYFLESLPGALITRFISHPDLPPPTQDQLQQMWKDIFKLHSEEAKRIEEGVYPLSALDGERPLQHLTSFLGIMRDGIKVAWRMRQGKHKDFSEEAEGHAKNLPEYYTRNFHFQTDGYLSEASARRYDHQVEILFAGTGGAMRRLILPVLKRFTRGEGRFLELGAGSGSATRPVLKTFPDAKVTALDLSAPYLKVAQDKLRDFSQVDFAQGDATNLEYKNETFDAVYSVFMMHELPKPERSALMREAYRVLKPGGVLILADSLQLDDVPEFNWALERFPKAYHEPFYTGYLKDDMSQGLLDVTGQKAEMEIGLFTKVVYVRKPLSSELS